MAKVYVCGDTHGSHDVTKLTMDRWPEQKELTSEDLLIVLGDFGFIWKAEEDKEELYWMKWLLNKPYQVAFVDGNHEGFQRLNSYPVSEKWGGKVHIVKTVKEKSIHHLMRGEIFTFGDSTVLTLGGAESVDKVYRKEHISWWKEEDISQGEVNNAIDNLAKVDYYVDFVLTHTCPTSILIQFHNLYKMNDKNSVILERIRELVTFKSWEFGHMHQDRKVQGFRCHYNNKPVRII